MFKYVIRQRQDFGYRYYPTKGLSRTVKTSKPHLSTEHLKIFILTGIMRSYQLIVAFEHIAILILPLLIVLLFL